MDIYSVVFSKQALKNLEKVPLFILDKMQSWVEAIELEGLREVRKLRGFRVELLKGTRKGQFSIRLNRSYRAIYIIQKKEIKCILVTEVNKHDY